MIDHDRRDQEEGRRTWLFQANPNKYRIETSLSAETSELWNLNQHWKEIRAGDRVLIWLSGEDAGIYAIGTVMTDPCLSPDSPIGQNYWYDPEEGRKVKARVRVRYDRTFLDRPLLKPLVAADPSLVNLAVLRSPRGTNFRVSDDEWNALLKWFELSGLP